MINPMMLMHMLRGGNPQQAIMSMMRQQANNPVISNAINMAEKKDIKGLEKLARNLCNEQGIDADKMIENIRKEMGI